MGSIGPVEVMFVFAVVCAAFMLRHRSESASR